MSNRSFVFGTYVEDYNFTGRQAEIKRLKQNFEEGVNTILISPRRWGKTSLVKRVCKEVDKDKVITIYLDIFACKTEYDFYNILSESILTQSASRKELWYENAKEFLARLTPKIGISPDPNQDINLSLGITPKTHAPEEILNLAEDIAKKKGKRLIICIDEFQQIGEFSNSTQVQKRLRTVWQQHQNASYCLFGSKRHLMTNTFQKRNMPFYQFGDTLLLKKIETSEWLPYITSHFADRKRTISTELAKQICETVNNYSSYVQQLSWLVYTQLEEGETATIEHLRSATNELLDTNELLFMQQIAPLSAYQLNFLRAMAKGVDSGFGDNKIRTTYDLGSPSNITRIKTALINADLIEIERDKAVFTDPIFNLWLSRNNI